MNNEIHTDFIEKIQLQQKIKLFLNYLIYRSRKIRKVTKRKTHIIRSNNQMLKQNNQRSVKQQKLYQAALKHKVRNLRAKVQSLLPINFCQKIQKRNKKLKKQYFRLIEMEYQKQNQHILNRTKRPALWKYSYNRKNNTEPFISKPIEIQDLDNFQFSMQQTNNCNRCKQNDFKTDKYNHKQKQREQNRSKNKKSNQNNKKLAISKQYHFEKLTTQEIQQIQEDKLYYLGDDKHIKAYDEYIKQKYSIKSTIPISNQVYKSVSKSTIAIGTNKNFRSNHKLGTNTSFQSNNFGHNAFGLIKNKKDYNNKGQTSSNRFDSVRSKKNSLSSSKSSLNVGRLFRNTTNEKFMNSTVQQNLVRINQQDQIKRILLSMQIKNKQQKVEQNFFKIQNDRMEQIRKQGRQKDMKIHTAQEKKRKIHNQAGQIIQLTQLLRKKCLKRKTYRPKSIIFQMEDQEFS